MKAQDVEMWAREVVNAVTSNHPVEDSKIELKAAWIEPDVAARRLAAHANAARGEPILWLIGVDERNSSIPGADPLELDNWYKSVRKSFDGEPPWLLTHANVRIDGQTVVALYFETDRYAPFVVKNPRGGYPEFEVPWREGTRLRAAKREELLHILVPVIKHPEIRLLNAKMTLDISRDYSQARLNNLRNRLTWRLEALLYITPRTPDRVVIPHWRCEVWFEVSDYKGRYRLPASFEPATVPPRPAQENAKPIKIGNTTIPTPSPPPHKGSLTIKCAESELLIDGPGSVRLISSAYTIKEGMLTSVPEGSADISIEVLPSNSEQKIVLNRQLKHKPKLDLAARLSSTLGTHGEWWM